MALVMLPCDLPWWGTIQKHLNTINTLNTNTTPPDVDGLLAAMHAIHSLCNIGLDPDEGDTSDPALFEGLRSFITTSMDDRERNTFFTAILPSLTRRALQLKSLRPPNGLHFSLQQHNERTELNREFVASLLAHCFFSTFPKRTLKTHPTLQDFNFTNFFKHLDCNFQRSKLRSFFQYFKIMDKSNLPPSASKIHVSRQVMSGKEWLTIEDWLECGLPLCPLSFKHEGRLDRARSDHLIVCFSSARVGGPVLLDGSSRECIQFCSCPELLVLLLCSEALEDNEVVTLEGVLQVTRISDPRNKATIEYLNDPPQLNICCMDGENYTRLPLSQYEEDNVLRELNKALLGFRQRVQGYPPPPSTRRLSPIGESFSSTPPEYQEQVHHHHHQEEFTSLHQDYKESKHLPTKPVNNQSQQCVMQTLSPRNRFIMLGSSGECLPVSRQQLTHAASAVVPSAVPAPAVLKSKRSASSAYSSCASEPPSPPDVFHSARTSVCEEDGDVSLEAKRYSGQLDTPERRSTFAARLREALCRAESGSSSDSSSYAIGISITGSSMEDNEIRMKRGGSRGFMLEDEKTRGWGEGTNSSGNGMVDASPKRNFGNSSKYSFSTDYSSELEEIYSQLGSWLEEMDGGECCGCPGGGSCHPSGGGGERQRLRDAAVVQFAGSLLKRTLSESFVGVVPVGSGEVGDGGDQGGASQERRASRLAMAARSLSLELARHKHKLAAQLVSVLGQKRDNICCGDVRPVATGNWGCGSRQLGDPQLKLLIQWLAASVAGLPHLLYYTCSHYNLLKLDTVCRVLLDRQWNVGESVGAILRFIRITLSHPNPQDVPSLFEQIIGCEERLLPPPTHTNSSSVSSDSCLDS